MSPPPIEHVDLDVIDALDFHYVPQCEHSQHHVDGLPHDDGPASVLVEGECPHCKKPPKALYLCERYWVHARIAGAVCNSCRSFIDNPYRPIARVKS